MTTQIRMATFNLENLDDGVGVKPPLAERIKIMQPQLERVSADIICFQEINSQVVNGENKLNALEQLLSNTSYLGFHKVITLTIGGQLYKERNLVTLSRYPILTSKMIRDSEGPRPSYRLATAIPPDPQANPLEWERPMVYTKIDIGNGRVLHIINVHLKSKLASNVPGGKIEGIWQSVSAWAEGSFISTMKRVGQALQARMLIDKIFDEEGLDSYIIIAGDFNTPADEVSFRAICGPVEETGNPAHAPRIMIPCENNIPDSARYSLLHLGKGQMLDHIVVSRPLLEYFCGAEIHNEALPDESGAFRTDVKFPESDHAPVIAVFTFPD